MSFFAVRALGLILILTGSISSAFAQSYDFPPLTLAIKYVAYQPASNAPGVIRRDQAQQVVNDVNRVYGRCGIHFTLEQYVSIAPDRVGLPFHPSLMSDLEDIRSQFDEGDRLVVITTGKWDHSGGLGADGANAWTMMPGERLAGTVVESSVGTYSNIIAHELGHYLNLDHYTDRANLMNPVIYRNSTGLTAPQCEMIRQTALTARVRAVRPAALSPLAPSLVRVPASVSSGPISSAGTRAVITAGSRPRS